jgi:dienelactone hydrolase
MHRTIAIAALIWAAPVLLCQQADANRRMLRDYLTKVAYGQLEARRGKVEAIRTADEFELRRKEFRAALLNMIGGLPAARPPLELRRTGRLDREGYRVEKIVYQSQPGFLVTANLYIPAGRGPFPAVLHSVGHSASAKNRAFYQTLSIGLVKNGFVVLTYDPLGQGERRVFWDRDLEDSKVGGTTTEHEMLGIQSLLAGESLARHMIWDGMRGIDLLESLPEVDRKRIGITGCSGGGTLTTYLAALDSRVAAAAPACYISSWQEQLQVGTGPQDAEQQFPGLLARGYDHADFVTAFAPKPYLMCSTDQDFFPVAGAERTFAEAKRIWTLLGAAGRVAWFHEPGEHGTPRATRERIYGWMKQWLAGGPAGPAAEPEFTTEQEEDLNATPTGQLATSLGGLGPSQLVRNRLAARAAAVRPAGNVAQTATGLTSYRKPAPATANQVSQLAQDGYSLEILSLQGPDGRILPAALATPAGSGGKGTVLYLSDRPAKSAFAAAADPDELARRGYTVLALDTSGRGETAPTGRLYSDAWFGNEYDAWLALMTGRTLVGLRAEDIVAAVGYLDGRGLAGGGVTGFAKGAAAVDLLHAAALSPRIARVLLEDMLVSWAAVARSATHRRAFEAIVPGALGKYDLPDLAASIAPRPVLLVNARSAMGVLLRKAEAARAYAGARSARVGLRRESESVFAAYPELR